MEDHPCVSHSPGRREYHFRNDTGDAQVTVYELFPGVEVAYASVHMGEFDFNETEVSFRDRYRGFHYLETILLLEHQRGYARRAEIAEELGFSKPSVTCAIKLLKEKGYITENERNHIRLTHKGRGKAVSIYERHRLITQLLIHLGAEPSVAEENACRIEHVISPDLTDAIRKYMNEAVAFG